MLRLEKLLVLIGVASVTAGSSQLLRFHTFQFMPQRSQVIGRLNIPRLKLSLPILDRDTPGNLALSVAHIDGTSVIGSLGNAGIAGHRDTSFRPLRSIRLGDRIETQTDQTVAYVVKTIKIVQPSDTSLLRETNSPLLTLVTCYPFNFVGAAPHRIVIQAEMVTQ